MAVKPLTVGIIVAVAIGVIVVPQALQSLNPNARPIVRSGSDFNDKLKLVESLSRTPLEKVQRGDELSDLDKADLKQSAEIFESLIAFQPDQFALYLGLGKVYQALGRHDDAISRLDAGAQRMRDLTNPIVRQTLAEAHYTAAISFAAKLDYVSAASSAEKATELFPKSPIYLTEAARHYVQAKQYARAQNRLEEALDIDKNYEPAKDLLNLLKATGKYEKG